MKYSVFKTESNKDSAQLILLSGFFIMLGTLTFVVLLNNLILTANLPTAGLDISKQDIKEFRGLVISEINYAATATIQYSQETETSNETILRNHFINYTDDLSTTISRVYATRGSSVNIVVNNVTFSSSITNRMITIDHFRPVSHNFTNKSMIIPMDEQQNNILKVYGFVWNIVNDTNIPVYQVMQNPVNMTNINNTANMNNISYSDFYLNLTTDDNFSESDGPGTLMNRTYSGGPFLIDFDDINSSTMEWIYNESLDNSITIHGLRQENGTNQTQTIMMKSVHEVAVFSDSGSSPIEVSLEYMDLPYTLLNGNDIINSLTLENYSVLLVHYNMTMVNLDAIRTISNWTMDGGVLFAESEGATTMDAAMDFVDNNTIHPWYGFIGINSTNSTNLSSYVGSTGPYVKLVNDSSILNGNPPLPLAGLVESGASFNPLSQTDNISGMYGPSTGEVMAFTLNNTSDAINNRTNIIGYAAYPNGTQIIFDDDGDGKSEYHFTFLEAGFYNGRVIYMAGNLSERDIQAQRIAAQIFYSSVSRQELALEANNINVTISYNDGRAAFEDNFLIII
jgi:hypothetical protein